MRQIHHHARELRSTPTDAERKLWQGLRGRQLSGFKFRRQYPIAGYIADFACPEARLVIELDGGHHQQQQAYDDERTRRMAVNGYRVLRFWNHEVLLNTQDVLAESCRHLQPLPGPPLHAGEGAKQEQS